MSARKPLLLVSPQGLYCPRADVHIDPWQPVKRALITHAHSDHARPGCGSYLAQRETLPLLRLRIGAQPSQLQGVDYGEELSVNGVRFSFYPAGHVPGSAQILAEANGERWVFSGDYKTESDGVSQAFEPVRCDVFISECTFGLPVFSWRPQAEVFPELHEWWRRNQAAGVSSVVCAYALGKAQRLLAHLDRSVGRVIVHSSVWEVCEALGHDLSGFERANSDTRAQGALVVAPPAIAGGAWLNRFAPYSLASLSGWMAIRGMRRRRGVERGFVLSDHADFRGLTDAVVATGASRVLLTHGYTAPFSRWLCEKGMDARELDTAFGSEDGEESP